MSMVRSGFVFAVIICLLGGVLSPTIWAASFTVPLTVVPTQGGSVNLVFTATQTGGNPIFADVYRLVSTSPPILAQFIPATQIASNIAVTSAVVTTLTNSPVEATNVANGFLPATVTVSQGRYWYLVVLQEATQADVNSVIGGAVADQFPPATLALNQFTGSCTAASSDVQLAFVNPFDDVVNSDSNVALNPGSATQFASPTAAYRMRFLLYRVAQSEDFDVVNDPIIGNIVGTQEVLPTYNRGEITNHIDTGPAGTALAYGIRILDTVGNQSGGSPLAQAHAMNVVTPPVDVAVIETLLAGVPVNCVTFTINTQSLVSDPLDLTAALIRIYARDDGNLVTQANLGSSLLIDTVLKTSGPSSEVITYYHEPTNPTLPRLNGQTYSYGVVLVTDNNRTSCVSNSVSIITTDILPPNLIELDTPADLSKINGVRIFSATVQDDVPAGSGIAEVTFTLGTNVLGVDTSVTVGSGAGTAAVSFDTTLIPDGTYIYSATAEDAYGNTLGTGSGDPGAGPDFTILVDNTPPTVTITSPAAGAGVNGSFGLAGTAADANAAILAVTVTYSTTTVDTSVVATGTSNWTATVPVDPLYNDDDILTVTVEALDECGLIGVATQAFCVDDQCASLSSLTPTGSAVFGPIGLNITGTVGDDDALSPCDTGINAVRLESSLNGFALTPAPGAPPQAGFFVFDVTSTFGLSDGQTSNLVVSATDGALDVNNACVLDTVSITADYSAPVCGLISPASGAVAPSHIIDGTAADVGAAGLLNVVVDIAGPVNSSTTYTPGSTFMSLFAPGVDGQYTITVTATDNVGNSQVCSQAVVTVDAQPPLVAITSPLPPNIGVNGSFILSGTAEDSGSGVQAVTVEYTTSAGSSFLPATVVNPGDISVTWSAVAPVDALLNDDDIFDVTATAEDGSGLTASATEAYFVDDTASCLGFNSPAANSSFYISDAGFIYNLDYADDDSATGTDTGVALVTYQVILSGVTDTLRDFDPPNLGLGNVSGGLVPGGLGLADGDISDISFCLVDGATGTANICCTTIEVIVDLTAPTCNIDAPLDGVCMSYANTILGATSITISASDAGSGLAFIGYQILNQASVVVDAGVSPAAGNSASVTFNENVIGLGDGTYTLVSQATDTVGNGGTCDSITFTVSTQGPLTTISSPFRAVVNGNVTVSGLSRVPSFTTGSAGLPGPGSPAGQSNVAVGDDTPVEVAFSGGFVFPFFGNLYNSVFVGPNGNLTFGISDPNFNESVAAFLAGPPRIAPHWDDFNPAAGGSVTYEQQADRAIFRYTNVPQFALVDQNTFSVTLYSTGAVLFEYGTVNAADGLVGVTPGYGGAAALVDISAASPVTMNTAGTYEIFPPGSADLDNLSIAFLPQNDLTGTAAAGRVDLWYPGSGGGTLSPVSATVEATAPLTPVVWPDLNPLNTDQGVEIVFGNSFEFPFYGRCWRSVWISTHGFLEFGLNTTPLPVFAPTLANVNGPTPKVMGFFGNIDGHSGGGTLYQQFDDRFRVIYDDVPTAGGSDINDITLTLYNTGAVTCEYGQLDYLLSPDFTTVGVGVGISGGVSGQAVDGYQVFGLVTNGVPRTEVDISGLSGAPALAAVTDNAVYQVFSAGDPFDVTPEISFQGSSQSVTLTPNPVDGTWSSNLVISATFCGDGDPFGVSAKGFGGCTAETRGASANKLYAIDRTSPTVSLAIAPGVTPCGGVGSAFTATGFLFDAGDPSFRINSGICSVQIEVWQGGVMIGSVPLGDILVGVTPIQNFLPWGPNSPMLPYNANIVPASYAIAPNTFFGLNVVTEDCAINVSNASETYPGIVPEIYLYDPQPPACTVLAPADGACFNFANTILGASDIVVTANDAAGCLAELGFQIYDATGSFLASGETAVSGAVDTATFSYAFMGLPDGLYSLVGTATDEVGNATQCPPIAFSVESQGPPSSIDTPVEAAVNVSFLSTGSASPNALTVDLWYPGPGGSVLSPLDATTVAAVSPTAVAFAGVNLDTEVAFGNGFEFPFYGACYSSVFISPRGYLAFGFAANQGGVPSQALVNAAPAKVMGLWSDIDGTGNLGGSTEYRQYDDRFVVRYESVPDSGGPGTNSFTITLYETGAVGLVYDATDVSVSNSTAVGISAGVVGQDPSGYPDVPSFLSNGPERLSTDLTAVTGAPVQADVTDQALYQIFAGGTFDLGGSFGIQGSSIQAPGLPLVANAWSYTFPVSATFCSDGDPYSISVKAFGGCNGNTRGPSENELYIIDRFSPSVSRILGVTSYTCINAPFDVTGILTDAAMGAAVNSGICSATFEIYQGLNTLGQIVANAGNTVPSIPTRPNVASVTFTGIIDPAALGAQEGFLGVEILGQDCAIDTGNVNGQFGGVLDTPQDVYYDPNPPLSQPICTRLFSAGAAVVLGVTVTTLYELDPDTGAILGSLSLPPELSSISDCALGADGSRVYYANPSSISAATTIHVFDSTTSGSFVLAATITAPASVTVISGLGVDDGVLYVNQQGDTQLYLLDAATGAYLGTQDTFVPLPGTDLGVTSVGSGAFRRTFFVQLVDPPGPPAPRDRFFESYPGGTIFITPGIPGFVTTGMGFSGTRLFQGRQPDNVIRDVATTLEQAAFAGGFDLNTLPAPNGDQICALAASPAVFECTICADRLPYRLAAAVTDTAFCGISIVDLFAFNSVSGPATALLINSASDVTSGLFGRENPAAFIFPPGPLARPSAGIAEAILDITQVLQLVPSGEGKIVVYSQATDSAGNTEALADALTRAITFTIDVRAPRVLSLAALPKAATSGYTGGVTVTVVLEDRGVGIDFVNDPPIVTGLFSALGGGALDGSAPVSLLAGPDANGDVTGTALIDLTVLSLPPNASAYIDFIVAATDRCNNATATLMIDRFIIDNATPCADDLDPFYPANDIIANGTGGGSYWSMSNFLVWTRNEMVDMEEWDALFLAAFPTSSATRPEVLAGSAAYPLNLEAIVGDCIGGLPEPDQFSSPSGVEQVVVYFATGTATVPPLLSAFFSNPIATVTGVVQLTGGGTLPCDINSASAVVDASITWIPPLNLPSTVLGSDDYVYFKTVVTDYAGNTLDPVFGPFLILDIIPPDPIIITAEALFGTPDVRLDWERLAPDNVGTVGYQIFRTRNTVDDVLSVNPVADFDLLATISAFDGIGQPITEYLDQTIPPFGVYAYYVVAFDAAGNGLFGGPGIPGNISNIVAAAPNDLVDPYPVTDLKVKAGEPENGIRLAWNIPTSPPGGGGPVFPTGDNVAISVWEIFRDQRTTALTQTEVSEPDGDIQRNPDLLVATVVNMIVPDLTTPTAALRHQPVQVVAEKASISVVTPTLLVLFMPPLDVDSVTRVLNQTTGEQYAVLAATGETISVTGTVLPLPTDVVLVDYLTSSRSFVDTSAVPGLPYSYAVVARDAAGNRSLISSSVVIGDATAVGFDTTPPAKIDALQANAVPLSEDILLDWAVTPYDEVGVVGYKAIRHLGADPIEVPTDIANTVLDNVMYPVIHLAPSAATVTITLATSNVDPDLLLVIDCTRMRLISSATDSANPATLPIYTLAGGQLTVANIATSPVLESATRTIFNNLKIVYFNPDLSLFNGSGFDGQVQYLDDTTVGGKRYNYVVMAVDPWGNMAPISNSAETRANDLTPPLAPLAVMEENCTGEEDRILVLAQDDDVNKFLVADDPFGSHLIADQVDWDLDRFEVIPVGDNLYPDLYVVAVDFAGNISPVVGLSNDVFPPSPLSAGDTTVVTNAPGTDDELLVVPNNPDVLYVTVYRDDSLHNIVDEVEDADDGFADGVFTLNLGDNLSGQFYVTVSDSLCNESDDLAIGNDVDAPAAPSAEVSNNVTGTGCFRLPVDDTIKVWVPGDAAEVDVFADSALSILVASEQVTGPSAVGPGGGFVGPISIGNNTSFDPGSLDGVYVVVLDFAGNTSPAVFEAVDIQAPDISELSVFEQFPQQPGTFPRVEDEVDVQIDIDTAEADEVLCLKIFTESPTLNRESPVVSAAFSDVHALAADATGNYYVASWVGAAMSADDLLVAVDQFGLPTTLDSSFNEPAAIAVHNLGQGNIWVASRNPGSPTDVRLTEITSGGSRVQDIDLVLSAPVAAMTFGATDVLYFVTESGGDVFQFDTSTSTLSSLISGVVAEGRGIAWDGGTTLYFSHLAVPGDPFSGQLVSVDLGSLSTNLVVTGMTEPAGLAVDRRGGLHFGETGLDLLGSRVVPQRIAEVRPGADGPLVLAEAGMLEPAATLAGPVIDSFGNLIYASQETGQILTYQGNRRSTVLVDNAIGNQIPPNARVLAQRVPGEDFRVEGVKIGDNKVHEVQACVVDKAGNTSNIVASAINDVVGPYLPFVTLFANPPGTEDSVSGFTEPFTVVRAYADPYLNNLIDREDNAVRADRTGFFSDLRIGDNLYPFVVLAGEDEAGNISFPLAVPNDIAPPGAPVAGAIGVISSCPGLDDAVIGFDGAVEPNCFVEIYADAGLTQAVGVTIADASGAFGPVFIGDDLYEVVWVRCLDAALNTGPAVALDGENGRPINDLVPPAEVDLANVDLDQAASGYDFITGLPGAVIPGDASLIRIYTDSNLTSELGGGLSPILVSSATGGWETANLGPNLSVNNGLVGYPSLWLVAEDDACNQSLPVLISLDTTVETPDASRFVFDAADPAHNTIAGIEAAVGSNVTIQFATSVVDFLNSVLGTPLLGVALSDEAGAFQPIDVGRIGQPTSYVLAVDAHGNISPVVEIGTADEIPPAPPVLDRILLTQRGRSFPDTVRGSRGAVGNGEEDLYLNAYGDASLTVPVAGFPLFIPTAGFNDSPAPGSFPETSIGDNYANNQVNPHTIAGFPEVWLAAEDVFGNESEPVRIALDVVIPDPDPTKIFVVSQNPQTDSYIAGMNRAVEGDSRVLVSADINAILLFGNFYSDNNGAWDAVNIGPLLRQPDVLPGAFNFPDRRDTVYVRAIDRAGNKSAIIPISVEVVTYAVLDAFGGIAVRNGLEGVADVLHPTFLPDGAARDIEPGFYRANGTLMAGSPVPEYTASPTGFYRLIGNGAIEAYGDVLPVDQTGFTPYPSDLAKDIEVAPQQSGPKVGIFLLEADGGLQVFGGAPPLIGISLGTDLARDFELDYNPDGTVKGGYILDGRGGLTNIGGSAPVVPPPTFLIDDDVFVDVELIRDPGDYTVQGAAVLSKFGDVSVGGTVDPDLLQGLPYFGFNIARDLELSIDRETGLVRGLYVLDGFGGVHTGGPASKIHDAPFFGFDVARDLEVLRSSPQQ